ncbi:thiolase family protein [Rhodococcoides yunnanense]|uniref:thiolase family protein n=1 Tax=Rhodococcoides yunnanense TaxID=278209 RepID=UPI000934EA80|nr:thiolase family protein [Rhodococcus yunnanensis]
MTGLRGDAAVVGFVELPAQRHPVDKNLFGLEQWSVLAAAALEDAGLSAGEVDGLVTGVGVESAVFAPATLAEYLGIAVNFGEFVDLGGATAAGAVWRAAAAIELGICRAVLIVMPGGLPPSSPHFPRSEPPWLGSSSGRYGSPQAEFEIPYGFVGQNSAYAQIARLYEHTYGYDARALAKISADQRENACATPGAIFHGKPISVDDVLSSPMVSDPLHRLEVVMPVAGGAGVVVANKDLARRSKNKPVWVAGFGERVTHKSPSNARDMLRSPLADAADTAFSMAEVSRDAVDIASIYDCYTITVLLSLEDAGFCDNGKGAEFVNSHDLTFRGDFPLNTAGGQLGYGQAGLAGGMHHVVDGVRQLMGRAGDAQVSDAEVAFVSGNGGLMSEQVALVLKGDK